MVAGGPPYLLDFGSANAGQVPTFTVFKNEADGSSLSQPTITEDEQGLFEFTFVWASAYPGVTNIRFKAVCNGVELSDVISSVPQPGTASSTAASFSTSGLSTAGTVINRAALQLGLLESSVATAADPFGSTDANFLQLTEYLNAVGQDLAERYQWTQLIKECTVSTASSATSYALPADFHSMVDQTGWNQSSGMPIIGPLSGQETQFLKARISGTLLNAAFRIQGNLLIFPVAPSDDQTIVFEYFSDYWIQTASSQTGADAKTATATTDVVVHDADLVIAGLKVRWLEDRGFDTVQAIGRYESRLEHCVAKNVGGRTLKLGGSSVSERPIDGWNVPITGYGS